MNSVNVTLYVAYYHCTPVNPLEKSVYDAEKRLKSMILELCSFFKAAKWTNT